jgi:hypothetical protein
LNENITPINLLCVPWSFLEPKFHCTFHFTFSFLFWFRVPSCSTWSPADWKHSTVPNDLTKLNESSHLLYTPLVCLLWLHTAMSRVLHPILSSFFWEKEKQ